VRREIPWKRMLVVDKKSGGEGERVRMERLEFRFVGSLFTFCTFVGVDGPNEDAF
jgi:hypothetical protein